MPAFNPSWGRLLCGKIPGEKKAEGIVEVESFSGVGRVDTIHTITGLLENVAKDFNAGGDIKKSSELLKDFECGK